MARSRRREKALAEEFFDKRHSLDVGRSVSPGPSITQVTTHAPTDVYVNRDVHFGSNYMDYGGQGAYGLDYPPGSSYTAQYTYPGSPAYGVTANDVQSSHQGVGQGSNLFGIPSHTYATGSVSARNAPPVSVRQPQSRDSGAYPPSIDSFYGGMHESYGQAM